MKKLQGKNWQGDLFANPPPSTLYPGWVKLTFINPNNNKQKSFFIHILYYSQIKLIFFLFHFSSILIPFPYFFSFSLSSLDIFWHIFLLNSISLLQKEFCNYFPFVFVTFLCYFHNILLLLLHYTFTFIF